MKPVNEYLEGQGRFSHLSPEMVRRIQQFVNAKATEVGLAVPIPATGPPATS